MRARQQAGGIGLAPAAGLDKIADNGVTLVTADISSALMASTRLSSQGNLETCDHCPRPPAVIR